MSGRSLFVWFESRPGRAKTSKIGTCFSLERSSARHNDCSREILQCGCNLRRSPVVLPTAFQSESARRKPSVFLLRKADLCPGDRRCHWKDNSCVVQLHCLYSQLRCIRTFRKMFSCLRRSDRRESDGMGHVVCSKNRVEDRNQLLECRILYNFIAAQMRSCTFWHCIAIHYS